MAYFKGEKTLDYLKTRIVVNEQTGCWIWQGSSDKKLGYGQIWFRKKREKAHRVFFILSGNIIPQDKELDHLCKNPPCVNPVHLEAVTHRTNILRKDICQRSHCLKGHELSGDNLVIRNGTHRSCKTCRRDRMRNWAMVHKERYLEISRKSYLKLGKRNSKRREEYLRSLENNQTLSCLPSKFPIESEKLTAYPQI